MRQRVLQMVSCLTLLTACSSLAAQPPIPPASADSVARQRLAPTADVTVPGPRGGAVAHAKPAGQQPTAASFRYHKSEGAHLSTHAGEHTFTVLVPTVREIWIADDGSGRLRQVAGAPQFLGARDRDVWHAAGAPDLTLGVAMDDRFGPGGLWPGESTTLSTDPSDLGSFLRARAAQTDNPIAAETFILVGDQLRETGAALELRKALFEVAQAIPGVQRSDAVRDRRDRVGVALSLVSDHNGARTRRSYLFDPATFALLAEQELLLERTDWLDVQPPAEIGWTTYLESATVASVDETP